jgi:hypothetical protein
MRSKFFAYPASHRNGGCTTTLDAPTSAASSADFSSFTWASRPPIICIQNSDGAWIERIGSEYRSMSCLSADASFDTGSVVTMISRPS